MARELLYKSDPGLGELESIEGGMKLYFGDAANTTAVFADVAVGAPKGSLYISSSGKLFVKNSIAGGSAADWDDMGVIDTADIATSAVTLAKLATGITPSHVVRFAGKVTWSGGGASLAHTVTGAAATDIVIATIESAPTEAASIVSVAPTADTVTITLSAANTSNDAIISYVVLNVAA